MSGAGNGPAARRPPRITNVHRAAETGREPAEIIEWAGVLGTLLRDSGLELPTFTGCERFIIINRGFAGFGWRTG